MFDLISNGEYIKICCVESLCENKAKEPCVKILKGVCMWGGGGGGVEGGA